MKIVLSLVVLVLLSSCGSCNTPRDAWNWPVNRGLSNDDNYYPTYTAPQVQSYTRLNNTQSTNYMINTNEGIKTKNCIRLPSGSMYCH